MSIPAMSIRAALGISRAKFEALAAQAGVILKFDTKIHRVNYDIYVNQCTRRLAPLTYRDTKKLLRAHYAALGSRQLRSATSLGKPRSAK